MGSHCNGFSCVTFTYEPKKHTSDQFSLQIIPFSNFKQKHNNDDFICFVGEFHRIILLL